MRNSANSVKGFKSSIFQAKLHGALLIDPDHLKAAYNALKIEGLEPLGFGYWNILDEGKISPQIPNKPIYMASSLNEFLNIRITS